MTDSALKTLDVLIATALCGDGEERADAPIDEETALVRAAREDPDVFRVLYDRYYAPVLNFLNCRTMDRDVAEDLTSQTFLSALDYLRRSTADIQFRPWIFRVALNTWLSHERAQKGMLRRVFDVGTLLRHRSGEVDFDQMDESRRMEFVRREILGLKATYREPLLLRYEEEMSFADIAVMLSINEQTARTRVSRGVRLLRTRLERLYPDLLEDGGP